MSTSAEILNADLTLKSAVWRIRASVALQSAYKLVQSYAAPRTTTDKFPGYLAVSIDTTPFPQDDVLHAHAKNKGMGDINYDGIAGNSLRLLTPGSDLSTRK